tara:strand:- start:75569 stop:75856 length:288 start_codon:yes stop_codon:yes gene_type:complete
MEFKIKLQSIPLINNIIPTRGAHNIKTLNDQCYFSNYEGGNPPKKLNQYLSQLDEGSCSVFCSLGIIKSYKIGIPVNFLSGIGNTIIPKSLIYVS